MDSEAINLGNRLEQAASHPATWSHLYFRLQLSQCYLLCRTLLHSFNELFYSVRHSSYHLQSLLSKLCWTEEADVILHDHSATQILVVPFFWLAGR